MTDNADRCRRIAILIDADNASPRAVERLFDHDHMFADASVRRIYGDFSCPNLKGWTDVIAKYAVVPQQNFAVTVAKNATDIALVIDAMDLLHTGRFEAFCIVSSDSDFTRLAARLREQGIDVHGYGERKTPACFRNACKTFILMDPDLDRSSAATDTSTPVVRPPPVTQEKSQHTHLPVSTIFAAIAQSTQADGWYHLGHVGARLNAISPGFNSKTFGSPNLSTLVERTGAFDIRRENLMVYLSPKVQARQS